MRVRVTDVTAAHACEDSDPGAWQCKPAPGSRSSNAWPRFGKRTKIAGKVTKVNEKSEKRKNVSQRESREITLYYTAPPLSVDVPVTRFGTRVAALN